MASIRLKIVTFWYVGLPRSYRKLNHFVYIYHIHCFISFTIPRGHFVMRELMGGCNGGLRWLTGRSASHEKWLSYGPT